MNLGEEILRLLVYADEPVSGETLAQRLCVSRNAVWKAVEVLRKKGFRIDAATNRGYILSEHNERLCSALIESRLKNGGKVLLFDETDSTNAVIKQLAEQGASQGTVAAAIKQTGGRGRLGRSFYSPDGGIYFSVLLRPSLPPGESLLLTVAAAVAVCRAIEKNSDVKCEIKWVNDIYVNGRKVCGILTEGAIETETASLKYAVVGIGINLTAPIGGYPDDIADRAAAVFGNSKITAEKKAVIAADTVNCFFELYKDIRSREFIGEYRRRSYLDGKTVTFARDGGSVTATVVGIDDNAGLIVSQNGKNFTVTAGDVTIGENYD